MSLVPDYDSDPDRWRSWQSPQDAHELVVRELHGPVLDAGCDEIRAYCHHNVIPPERAEDAEIPLWLTKRGVLVRARKP